MEKKSRASGLRSFETFIALYEVVGRNFSN